MTVDNGSGRKRVLIFTDSRGQHKPAGSTHDLFAERLASDERFDVEMYLCPMKWTTTLDFLERFPPEKLAEYDSVILYTGIVDWSPRPQLSAQNDLYNNPSPKNLENLGLKTENYSKKIVNNKKEIFDRVFSEGEMESYLGNPFPTKYEGQETINMYGLEMARKSLLPYLKAIPNLIFISANRFVPGWEGDFKRGRPENISITHQYSDLFAESLLEAGRDVLDLRQWSNDEIKTYTCDNIHLTEKGSDWIYQRLLGMVTKEETKMKNTPDVSVIIPIFNMEAWLEECLTSVENQTLKNIEVLLIDDGSTDGSADICQEFCKRDSRFRYIRQENSGLGPARNTGIRNSTAPYVIFLDSDDTVADTYCEKPYKVAVESNHDIVSCKFRRTNEAGIAIDDQSNFLSEVNVEIAGKPLSDGEKVLALLSSSISCARLYRRSFLLENELFFPTRLPHEDWFFTYKALLLSKSSGYVVEPLYFWRVRDGSLSKSTKTSHVDSLILLISDTNKFLDSIKASDELRSIAARRLLTLLVQIYNRSKRSSSNVYDYFVDQITRNFDSIAKERMFVERAYISDTVYQNSGKVLENAAAVTTIRNFSAQPEFAAARKKFYGLEGDGAEKILSLKNAFAGKRCFIIGNGPSLNKNDLSLLKGEYTFAVNSFFLKTRDIGFVPSFYVVEDNKVMEENADDIREYPAPFRFFPEDYRRYNLANKNTCFFNLDQEFYMKSKPHYGIPRFSADARRSVFAGQTVTYVNMQLAFYLGFSEVYLIGMDFNYVIPSEHKREGNHIISTTDDPNHFHKDYFGKGKTWKDPQLDRVLLNYRMADLAYEAANRKVYNATVGGKLEIFDRVDYDRLLRDPETGKKRTEQIAPAVVQRGSLDRQMGRTDAAPSDAAAVTAGDGLSLSTVAAQLMLDPAGMMPRVMPGGDLAVKVDALLNEKGTAADHFEKVRAWAQSQN